MANFSVEWLSKSYYEDSLLHSKVHGGSRDSPTSPNGNFTNDLRHKRGDQKSLYKGFDL